VAKLKTLPLLRMVEWLGKNEVRLFFATGRGIKVVEMFLPWVKSAKGVRIVDRGMGLDPGDGLEVSSWDLWEMPGKTIRFPRKASARKSSRGR
jgi:hypothetical protein